MAYARGELTGPLEGALFMDIVITAIGRPLHHHPWGDVSSFPYKHQSQSNLSLLTTVTGNNIYFQAICILNEAWLIAADLPKFTTKTNGSRIEHNTRHKMRY